MLHYCVRVSAINNTDFCTECLLDALRPSSYECHTGLTTGGGGVLPRSRYCTPGPISVQPRDAVTRH